MTYHWKGLLTKYIITLRKGFHEIPIRWPVEVYQLSNFDQVVPFWTGLTYTRNFHHYSYYYQAVQNKIPIKKLIFGQKCLVFPQNKVL